MQRLDQIFGTNVVQTRVMLGIGVAVVVAKVIARSNVSPIQKVTLILDSGLCAVLVHT